MSRSYCLTGIILRQQKYLERDTLLTIFSQEQGKQTFLAKGVRSPRSRRAGILQLFHQIELMVAKGRGHLDIVADTKLICSYPHLATDFQKLRLGYQVLEMVLCLTAQEQPHPELFELLKKVFQYLDSVTLDMPLSEAALNRFQHRILDMLGFGLPEDVSYSGLCRHIEELTERKLVARKYLVV